MPLKTATAIAAALATCTVGALAAYNLPSTDARAQFTRPGAIPFPAGNPYSPAKAELGRRLFFETALSDDRTRSCATCHDPAKAWGDGLPKALGRASTPLPVRTPTLLDIAWQDPTGKAPMGWDGKFAGVDAVSFGPITGKGNMNLPEAEALARIASEPGYDEAFSAAFGDPSVTRPRVEAALGTFMRLLVSGEAPFDRWAAGDGTAVGDAAKRGFSLFTGKANCAACHSGYALTDGSFHDIGTSADPGRGRLFPDSERLWHAQKTPGLRGLSLRAPYMHDGSLPTLEAVIDLYDKGGVARPSRSHEIRPLGLTPVEKADLVAFLRSLDPATPDVPAMGQLAEAPPRP